MANLHEDIVNIELEGGSIHRSFLNHSIGEGDNNANRFGVRLFRNGVPENVSGSCFGLFIRADGATVAINDGTVSENVAYVTLPDTCYAVEGQFCLTIKVSTASDTTTLRIVDGVVSRTSTNAIVDPGTIIPSIDDLIEAIDEAVASIPPDYSDLVASVENTQKTIQTTIDTNTQKNYNFPPRMTTDLLLTSDENGNILSCFDYKGHFKVKDFDASRSVMRKFPYTPLICDFAIQDEDGNIAFSIVNGFAITNQRLYGKKISILGDSISTFAGWIPEGYAAYYPNGNINDVRFTWWHKLIDELGLDLVCDASWSGSSVSGDSQGTGWAGCSDARISALAGENEETPDIILVYIGTNDWAGDVQIGSFTDKDEIPSEGVIREISKAYALMLYKIRTTYPFADVYCITSLEGRQTNDTTYPIVNGNGDTIHDVNHAISEIAHIFGCKVIDLNTSGIHFWNISAYTTDGTIHPNRAGAEVIKEVVKMYLINNYHNKS